jgi:hypothetical protein
MNKMRGENITFRAARALTQPTAVIVPRVDYPRDDGELPEHVTGIDRCGATFTGWGIVHTYPTHIR